MYLRTKRGQKTKVPQSGGSPKKVGDEAINEEMFDNMERIITTDASLDAAQDSDNITKTQSTATLNEPQPQRECSASGPWCQETMGVLLLRLGEENDKTSPMLHESDFDGFDDETVDVATTGVSTASAPVTTAGVAISTVEPRTPPTTTTVFDDEYVTMAMDQTLIKMKIQKEKATQEEVSMAAIFEEYDTIQASIDADALFAAKLQQEDREQYTIEERAKFLAEKIAAQRKFGDAQRAAEIRRLYEREQKFIHDFVPMDSEKEEKESMEPESEGKKSKRLKRTA
ncbi:hypothetical protein Tco_1154360 [Tanacetum coccineum]